MPAALHHYGYISSDTFHVVEPVSGGAGLAALWADVEPESPGR